MHRIVALFLLIFLFPTANDALAQDRIGIFFDDQGLTTNATTTTAYQSVEHWLLLLDPSQTDGITGWECEVRPVSDGPEPILNWEILGLHVVVSPAPMFLVGMAEPHPWASVIPLARANILVPDPAFEVALHVMPFDPPSLLDPPGYGYPVYKPAYGHGEGNTLHPMEVSSGCETLPTALINDDGIGPDPTVVQVPGSIYIGNVAVGASLNRSFLIANNGTLPVSGTLSLDMNDVTYMHDGGFWTADPTGFRINPGNTLTVSLSFSPQVAGVNSGQMSVNFCGVEKIIELHAGGDLDCQANTETVQFGNQNVGSFTSRTFFVRNSSPFPVDATPRLEGECDAFSFTLQSNNIDPANLPPNWPMYIDVVYAPQVVGQTYCNLMLGFGSCGAVVLQGRALDSPPVCEISPQLLDFGDVVADSSRVLTATISNGGGGEIAGNAAIDDPSGAFSIISGGGDFALAPGISKTIQVRFSPQAVQSYFGAVTLGTSCADITLSGDGIVPYFDFDFSPDPVDFRAVKYNTTVDKYLRIWNQGPVLASGDLQIAGHPEFSLVDGGPFTLLPNEFRRWKISFMPTAFGEHSAVISAGLPGGETVDCRGFGVEEIPSAFNQLGFYFNQGYTQSNISPVVPGTILLGYLVVKNTSAPVGGWEMFCSISGDAEFLSWDFNGDASGELGPEIFRLTLASPLPPGQATLLATAEILVPTSMESQIFMKALVDPVIPGYASYVDAEDAGNHLPIGFYNQTRTLAHINQPPVGVEAPPAPLAQLQGSQVLLKWTCDDEVAEGYHVYRRSGNQEPQRLTVDPVVCSAGFGVFNDSPTGPQGTKVAYTLTYVSNGFESSPSVAAEVMLTGVVPARARLRNSYPNPFNPQTTIPFEVGKAGHIRLSVYDAGGRLVKVLADGVFTTGLHDRVWLGRDQQDRSVPSGIYYLRLESAGRNDIGKVMMLK